MNQNFPYNQPRITWFVSRHPGAIEWAKREGLAIGRWVAHLDQRWPRFFGHEIGPA